MTDGFPEVMRAFCGSELYTVATLSTRREGGSVTYRVRQLFEGRAKRNEFARFVVVGVATSTVYTLLYVLLAGIGDLAANAVGLTVSTVLANEMHRRLTFRAAERTGFWPAQLESGFIALIALGITTATVAIVNQSVPTAAWTFEVAVVLAVTGAIGAVKFFALRGLVFA